MLRPPTDTHFEIYVTDAEISESRRRTRWVYQRVCPEFGYRFLVDQARDAGQPHGQFPAEWVFDVWILSVVGTKVLRVAFPPEVTRPYVRTTRQFDAGPNLRFIVDSIQSRVAIREQQSCGTPGPPGRLNQFPPWGFA